MSQHRRENTHTGTEGKPFVLMIPLEQLSPDPHQPRKNFRKEGIATLLASIQNESLQQLPTVNPATVLNGKPHYIIKSGERRYHAFRLGGFTEMPCIVLPESYDGTYSVDRDLAQASENACREPHTHTEIVLLTRRVVEQAIADNDDKKYGAVGVALERISGAFGFSKAWANNYHQLSNLHPDLLERLDAEDDDRRLNFQVACALAVVPADKQKSVLKDAESRRAKGGYAAMREYISQEARRIREDRGEKVRGINPSDERRNLVRLITTLSRISEKFCGERHSSEYRMYVEQLCATLSPGSVDQLLGQLKPALVMFSELKQKLEERKSKLRSAPHV